MAHSAAQTDALSQEDSGAADREGAWLLDGYPSCVSDAERLQEEGVYPSLLVRCWLRCCGELMDSCWLR